MVTVINKSGRRKTAIARVYVTPGGGAVSINKRTFENYFKTDVLRSKVLEAFQALNLVGQYDVKVNVKGGGTTGQAEAIRLAIAKALVSLYPAEENPEVRPTLKKLGLLTRDPRMVERKKFGQRKARKRFQFSKR